MAFTKHDILVGQVNIYWNSKEKEKLLGFRKMNDSSNSSYTQTQVIVYNMRYNPYIVCSELRMNTNILTIGITVIFFCNLTSSYFICYGVRPGEGY